MYCIFLVVINCGFESGWCGFQNEKQDNFDWTLTSKSTPSVGTGPKHDISGKGRFSLIRRISIVKDTLVQIVKTFNEHC